MANIKFGTDGWRAILGKDFNDENFTLVTNAIAKYIAESKGLDKVIVIGYDPRCQADEYAEKCAKILAKKGFTVKLSERIIPTPVLAYYAGATNSCAIMFTASHNPPEYLGMKFIPEYAGPATDDITSQIVANIGKDLPDSDGGQLVKMNLFDIYLDGISALIDFDRIKKSEISFIFDGFYSATIGYFDKVLESFGIPCKTMRMLHDTNFGGGMPDPKPKYLKPLMEYCKEHAVIGFANDGDGDRFGVIDENGEYVSPNEIISILAKHLKEHKGLSGAVIKTVGSSILIEKVAQKLELPVVETAVGFKHIGQAMRDNKTLIGGEESGGLSIGGHIPEKDGILANLLILEALAYSGKKLVDLRSELYDFVGEKFYTDRNDYKLSDRAEINRILEFYKNVKEVAGHSIMRKNTIDGVKLYIDNSTSILIRPSGTEPLLRVYFECASNEMLENLKNFNYVGI